jgi:hypothetical protein
MTHGHAQAEANLMNHVDQNVVGGLAGGRRPGSWSWSTIAW